ncbi:MAG: 4-diphosphocytidyl-2-C-methyl-D-erythritol kinase [Thermotogota bacterium]|nr:4-diphosphocytidyl-2-C-methyl-D-erythritol kinase [Thermotogota bacterium]MDK2865105.1 4-diphosphocytidyl-2-C-methyl-D-erythritol kinase [Thermotogota bacterium]
MSLHLLRAPAKINLFLKVLDRLDDGYHEIESLIQTIDLSDYLEVELVKDQGIWVEVLPRTLDLDLSNNTLTRVYEVLKERYEEINFGMKIKLHKHIPIGGGLGGGSSDAAALLRFLKDLLSISTEEAIEMAFEIGSDVPALIMGGTVLVKGRGEIVSPLEPLPKYGVFLRCPGVHVDTGQAYQWLDGIDVKSPSYTALDCYEALKKGNFELLWNDFQPVVSSRIPVVEEALREMEERHQKALLTGSGSCVFALNVSRGDHSFLPGFDLQF